MTMRVLLNKSSFHTKMIEITKQTKTNIFKLFRSNPSMKSYEILDSLRKAKKPIITTNDIAKFGAKNRKYASLLAKRLVKRGMLKSIEKGKYCLPETPVFAVASTIIFPAYISFLSAFYLNALTDQMPSTVTVITLRPRPSLQIDNVKIQFVAYSKSRFFGYKKESIDGWPVFVAESEKAIADCLFSSKYSSATYLKEVLGDKSISKKKLLSIIKKFYPKFVLKRFKNLTGARK